MLRVIGEKHPGWRDLMLVADQFEELYTLCPDRDAANARSWTSYLRRHSTATASPERGWC